jgi:hypothetical protein
MKFLRLFGIGHDVSSIMAGFHRIVARLEAHAVVKSNEATAHADAAAAAMSKRADALHEAERASAVALNVKHLIGA